MTEAAAPSAAPVTRNGAFRAIFTAAWMAIALGLVLQFLIFAAKTSVGAHVPGAQLLVDVAGGVTWALIVCAGVAIGTVATRNASAIMGILGLICAPLAFAAAKGVQRAIQWVMGQPTDKIGALVIQTGLVKMVEYAALGLLLGHVIRTEHSTLRNHFMIGALFGLVFSWFILALNIMHSATLPTPKVVGLVLNEFVFPMGCSLVIYAVAKLSDPGSAMERAIAGGG